MEIDTVIIRIAFFALPGLLASKLYRKLRGPTRKRVWEDFVELLLFTTLCYLPLALFSGSKEFFNTLLGTLDGQSTTAESLEEMFSWFAWAIGTGILFAVISGYLHTYGLLAWLAQKIGCSYRTGDEDIWDYFLMKDVAQRNNKWVLVRDHELNLVYYGCIREYSESREARELIMENVQVLSNEVEGEPLYEVSLLYLSREATKLSIEIPKEKGTSKSKKDTMNLENDGVIPKEKRND